MLLLNYLVLSDEGGKWETDLQHVQIILLALGVYLQFLKTLLCQDIMQDMQ